MGNTDNHKDRAHAKYGPSSSSGWLNCQKYQSNSTGSYAADRGTLCHEVAEKCLLVKGPKAKTGKAEYYVGKEKFTRENGDIIVFDNEMAKQVQSAVVECRAFMKLYPNAHWSFEVRLEPTGGFEDCWGTVDILGIEVGVCVIIADFKFGRGYVDVEKNEQLMEYARLAAPVGLVDFDKGGYAIGKIIQPARNTKVGDFATYTSDDMTAHIERVSTAMSNIKKGLPVVKPTEKGCQWCAIRDNCDSKKEEKHAKVAEKFKTVDSNALVKYGEKMNIVLPAPDAVDPAHVQHFIAFKKVFDTWYKDFLVVQQQLAVDDEAPMGTKVVKGKLGNRKWVVSDDEMISHFVNFMARQEKDVTTRKVMTPTQAEKSLTTAEYQQLINGKWIKQDEGKPVLALEDDKRKHYDLSSIFKPVDGE